MHVHTPLARRTPPAEFLNPGAGRAQLAKQVKPGQDAPRMGQEGPCRTNLQGAVPSSGSSVALFPNSGGKGTPALGVMKRGAGLGYRGRCHVS